jgi:hypothetical protein
MQLAFLATGVVARIGTQMVIPQSRRQPPLPPPITISPFKERKPPSVTVGCGWKKWQLDTVPHSAMSIGRICFFHYLIAATTDGDWGGYSWPWIFFFAEENRAALLFVPSNRNIAVTSNLTWGAVVFCAFPFCNVIFFRAWINLALGSM